MKEKIEQIRRLLGEIEAQEPAGLDPEPERDFSALELPLVIQEIVDDLQPLLTAHEIAFYWHMFRHSIAENGKPLVRVSTRKLQSAFKSARSHSQVGAIALQTSRKALVDP